MKPTLTCLIGIAILLFGSNASVSQALDTLKKINVVPLKGIDHLAIDRLGNPYGVFTNLSISKYDTDGKFQCAFANPEKKPITQLEPWNPLRVFIYSKETQEIVVLDRSLLQQEKIKIDASLGIDPLLTSPGNNNSYWLLDGSDLTLKKIDYKNSEVTLEISLNKSNQSVPPHYIFLREYQNMIFLLDEKTGIEIYSIVGKQINKIEAAGLSYVGFLGQELYYLEEGKLKFYDLYTEETHQFTVGNVKQALATDERLILLKGEVMEVYEFKPMR
jgi:hypothetical protein